MMVSTSEWVLEPSASFPCCQVVQTPQEGHESMFSLPSWDTLVLAGPPLAQCRLTLRSFWVVQKYLPTPLAKLITLNTNYPKLSSSSLYIRFFSSSLF